MSVKYFGGVDPPNFDGCMSVKYLGSLHPADNSRMGMRKIFDGHTSVKYSGGCIPPKYLTDVCPSNILGV